MQLLQYRRLGVTGINQLVMTITSLDAVAQFSGKKQEKPTNCGTKAADVLADFLAGKLKCESTDNFGAVATAMTSQRVSNQRVAASATIWP